MCLLSRDSLENPQAPDRETNQMKTEPKTRKSPNVPKGQVSLEGLVGSPFARGPKVQGGQGEGGPCTLVHP